MRSPQVWKSELRLRLPFRTEASYMHRGSGLEESSLSSGRPSKDIGLTTLIDLVEVGDITEIVIMATVTPVRIVRTTQVEAHLQVVVAVTRQAVAQILQSVRSIGLSGMTKIETTMEMAFLTRHGEPLLPHRLQLSQRSAKSSSFSKSGVMKLAGLMMVIWGLQSFSS